MEYKRVLTIQDISCVGQCSLTVALPIISACGHETCILPSAVLSTHTAGFKGWTFTDLTEDMPAIKNHWKNEGIAFDCIYTGYLGSKKQIDYVTDIMRELKKDVGVTIVDPAMADNGKLYVGFDMEFVKEMAKLCAVADYVVPNITEACFMTGVEYKEVYDRAYIDNLLNALKKLGVKNIVLTGVSYAENKTGVVVYENDVYNYYEHEKLPKGCHGTGDIYASAFVGAYLKNNDAVKSAKIAADYAYECIRYTQANLPDHTYGCAFEPNLKKLINSIE